MKGEMDFTYMIQSSPEQIGLALKKFSQIMKERTFTEDDIIEFFSNKENLDATESFVQRHPECPYSKYIPNERRK